MGALLSWSQATGKETNEVKGMESLLSWSHATGLDDFRVAELGKLGTVVRMIRSVGV